MLGELNNQYGADIFIAANTRQMANDFVNNPGAYGNQIKIIAYGTNINLFLISLFHF